MENTVSKTFIIHQKDLEGLQKFTKQSYHHNRSAMHTEIFRDGLLRLMCDDMLEREGYDEILEKFLEKSSWEKVEENYSIEELKELQTTISTMIAVKEIMANEEARKNQKPEPYPLKQTDSIDQYFS